MSSSLKSFAPGMARILGMTPAALYERQRALVRGRVLEAEGSRGPGSGVRSTAKSVSLLLIASLCSEGLSDTADQTTRIAEAKSVDGPCSFTKHTIFLDALRSLMFSDAQASKIVEITISRNAGKASITFISGRSEHKTVFVYDGHDDPVVRVDSTIAKSVFREIAKDVKAIVEESIHDSPENTS